MIDLRSDTVTQPTPEMRQAFSQAPVGDDVFEEDPTVKELESEAARMLGKAGGLFVPSGTMGNLLALLTHTKPGDEVVLEAQSHIYYYEVGGISRIAGLTPLLLSSESGVFSVSDLKKALRPRNIHFPETSLLCLENTHNRLGGRVLPHDQVLAVAEVAKNAGLRMHLDGARLFHAVAASDKSVEELADPFDSVMCCLSKGLASPVGSVLVGSKDFITKARKFRKMLGGGMRQAGILAAAGLESLRVMSTRLGEDHKNAQLLAAGLGEISGITVAAPVETNMVLIEVCHESCEVEKLLRAWEAQGILALAVGRTTIRLVTHYQVSKTDIQRVIDSTNSILSAS